MHLILSLLISYVHVTSNLMCFNLVHFEAVLSSLLLIF